MNSFDWEDFRHFAALAQALHLGRAAGALRTSQVTVMRRVKALESRLGVTLFARRRDGHRLTAEGARLLGIAREAELVLSAVDRVVDRGKSSIGRVRLATTEVGANWLLLPQLRSFHHEHPGIQLEIDAGPNAVDLLEDSETIALRFRRPKVGPYTIKRIGVMPCGLYASRDMARAFKASQQSWPAIFPFIGWAGAFAEIGLARWLRTTFQNRQPAVALTTLHGHIEAGRAGIGVVGLPDFVGRKFKDLVRIDEAVAPFSLEAWLVVPSQVRQVARIKTVANFVECAVKMACG